MPSVSRGIKFAIGGRLISMILQGASSIILGRVLHAADFGLVNFSGIITGFVSRFNDMGIESAVIQRAAIEPRTLTTAFSVKLAMSITLMLLLWSLAGPLAKVLDSPQAVPLIRLMSVTFVITALSFAPIIRLRKSLRYDSIARIWAFSTLAGAICSIILALAGAGYWSIALGQVASSLVSFAVAQWQQPSSYALHIDWRECRRLLSFGGRVFLSSLLVFACFNLDSFLVGLKLGATALGFYGIAFNWATQICSFVSGTVLSVLFPAFANFNGDRAKVCDLYLNSVRQLGLFGAMAYGVFVFVSPEFLVLILGRGTDKWIPALPVLQILCVYGLIRQLLEPLGNALLALGRADLLWRSSAIVVVTELTGVATVLWLGGGIVAVAWVVLAAYSVQYFYYFRYVPQDLGASTWHILRLMIPSVITVVILTFVSTIWPWQPTWVLFIAKLGVGFLAALLLYGVCGGSRDLQFAASQIRLKMAVVFRDLRSHRLFHNL
jgi:lipopolysaccharide exporter